MSKIKLLRNGAMLEGADTHIVRERMGAMARGARAALGLSIKDVAAILGVNHTQLSAFELARDSKKKSWMGEDKIKTLSELLRCPPLRDELSRLPSIADRRANLERIEKLEALGGAHPCEIIFARRLRMGITRRELATRSGVARGTIESLEIHGRLPRRATLWKLEKVLGDGLDSVRGATIRRLYKEKHKTKRRELKKIPLEKRTLAQRVLLARLEAGLSREAVALISGFGPTCWKKIEIGEITHPWRLTIETFAQTLDDDSILDAWRPIPFTPQGGRTPHGGDVLRMARISAGLNPWMAAERFGCHRTTLARWERNARQPDVNMKSAIVRALGFDPWAETK